MNRTIGFLVVAIPLLVACSDQKAPTESKSELTDVAVESQSARPVSEAEVKARRLAEEQAEKARQGSEAVDEGEAYLYINARKPGVKVMESGLQFEILEQGDGRSPGPASNVVTHYTGRFINGEVFDSSVDRGQPAEFPVNRVIAGWTEALQMMKEGDVWRLVIPSELAYGERGTGGTIPPNSVLIFEVELIEVKD